MGPRKAKYKIQSIKYKEYTEPDQNDRYIVFRLWEILERTPWYLRMWGAPEYRRPWWADREYEKFGQARRVLISYTEFSHHE